MRPKHKRTALIQGAKQCTAIKLNFIFVSWNVCRYEDILQNRNTNFSRGQFGRII